MGKSVLQDHCYFLSSASLISPSRRFFRSREFDLRSYSVWQYSWLPDQWGSNNIHFHAEHEILYNRWIEILQSCLSCSKKWSLKAYGTCWTFRKIRLIKILYYLTSNDSVSCLASSYKMTYQVQGAIAQCSLVMVCFKSIINSWTLNFFKFSTFP